MRMRTQNKESGQTQKRGKIMKHQGLKLWSIVVVFTLFSFFLLVPGPAMGQQKVKVAALLPGSISDASFNAAAYQALEKVKEQHGVEYVYQENVPQAEFEAAFREYAKAGYDVVIGHGFQFGDAALKVAQSFPKTKFIVTETFITQEPNVASYQTRFGDMGFVAGALAAMMTESGVVGNASAIPIPVITDYMEGFKLGAAYINPDVKALTTYVGSLSDVAKGKEGTLALIEQGADVVTSTGNENNIGTVLAAKEKGALAIGTLSDMHDVAPGTVLVSIMVDFGAGIGKLIDEILNDRFQPTNYRLGFEEGGSVSLSSFHEFEDKVPSEAKERLKQIVHDIVAGKLKTLPEKATE
jgi:basic membrane protein A